jgi:CBS-domain-containing membrane protein
LQGPSKTNPQTRIGPRLTNEAISGRQNRVEEFFLVDELEFAFDDLAVEAGPAARVADGALATPVSGIMSKTVKTCKVGDSETELMALMTTHRIRHLPVVDGGKLAGMISIGDIVKFRIEAIEREAEDMKSYIAPAG